MAALNLQLLFRSINFYGLTVGAREPGFVIDNMRESSGLGRNRGRAFPLDLTKWPRTEKGPAAVRRAKKEHCSPRG